jgi:hypothetical protein
MLPDGYVLYQSVVQPDGRYAYDPDRVQYPKEQLMSYVKDTEHMTMQPGSSNS